MKKVVSSIIVLIMLLSATPVLAEAHDSACWGQASAVYARMGKMGEHASEIPTPRIGLRNLAQSLYEADMIAGPTMEALGQFVALAASGRRASLLFQFIYLKMSARSFWWPLAQAMAANPGIS